MFKLEATEYTDEYIDHTLYSQSLFDGRPYLYHIHPLPTRPGTKRLEVLCGDNITPFRGPVFQHTNFGAGPSIFIGAVNSIRQPPSVQMAREQKSK